MTEIHHPKSEWSNPSGKINPLKKKDGKACKPKITYKDSADFMEDIYKKLKGADPAVERCDALDSIPCELYRHLHGSRVPKDCIFVSDDGMVENFFRPKRKGGVVRRQLLKHKGGENCEWKNIPDYFVLWSEMKKPNLNTKVGFKWEQGDGCQEAY